MNPIDTVALWGLLLIVVCLALDLLWASVLGPWHERHYARAVAKAERRARLGRE